MWAHHWWNPLLPAPADNPHLRRGAPPLPLPLSSGSAVFEKSGPDWFSGAFGRNLSLLTQVMLKSIRGSELGIGDLRLRNARNERLGGPRGPTDHGRGQTLLGALRALTVRWFRGWMDSEEFSKLRPHGQWPKTLA